MLMGKIMIGMRIETFLTFHLVSRDFWLGALSLAVRLSFSFHGCGSGNNARKKMAAKSFQERINKVCESVANLGIFKP